MKRILGTAAALVALSAPAFAATSLNDEQIVPSVTEKPGDPFTNGKTEAGAPIDQELNETPDNADEVGSMIFDQGPSDAAEPISVPDEATVASEIEGGTKDLTPDSNLPQNRAEANGRPVEEQS